MDIPCLPAILAAVPDVAPEGALDEPLWLFAIAVFGFAVVMLVWSRRQKARREQP